MFVLLKYIVTVRLWQVTCSSGLYAPLHLASCGQSFAMHTLCYASRQLLAHHAELGSALDYQKLIFTSYSPPLPIFLR